MNSRKIFRKQTVARHGHENARLAELEHEQHGGRSSKRAGANQRTRPRFARERRRDCRRVAKIDGVFLNAGQHDRHQHVEQRADDQTRNDPNRHVALRIFCFLGRRRNGVESDEREKDNRRATHYTGESVRHKRVPVRRINHERAERNDENHDRCFDDDDCCVGAGAFANAVNKQRGNRCDDHDGR